jgi:acyl-CoA synthetase (NDP forming)
MVEVLAKQPRPKGPHLTIVTNAGGPSVLATDMLATTGGELATLSPETTEHLSEVLPPFWSHSNPVDILGDATPERYLKTVDAVLQDPNSDGALVILTPQAMTEPTQIAEQLKDFIKTAQQNERSPKPILASWMGGAEVKAREAILIVSDRYQRQGLGTELLRRILDVARDEKLASVSAQILPENGAMQRVCEKVGFELKRSPRLTIASIQLP